MDVYHVFLTAQCIGSNALSFLQPPFENLKISIFGISLIFDTTILRFPDIMIEVRRQYEPFCIYIR